ncbi:MAG: succinate dehydrogenase, cytochrome b556 subunit [Oceanospirillaceae bacterium]|nr:succinate dehydrogenase, cytochrome b556 subunit [Oceanospirillaceae bacterium]
MNKQRPVNLDLRTIQMPITANASILHRVSAVVLWVGMAFFLPAIFVSLASEEGYLSVRALVTDNFIGQFVAWGLLSAFSYYGAATLKHVIQEMGHFEELESGSQIATAVMVIGVVLSIAWGIWIWI